MQWALTANRGPGRQTLYWGSWSRCRREWAYYANHYPHLRRPWLTPYRLHRWWQPQMELPCCDNDGSHRGPHRVYTKRSWQKIWKERW